MNAQTIFVVNHASAFLDPWVVAELQNPVLFFLTRGDIFKTWLKPITWAAHMIPIFRTKENGADSAEKNEVIFKEVYRLLKRKKSIMIFGEGYTDDVFIRSLKPLKKGPARIGFGAMESTNWEVDIKIQCIGINYADPNEFRSEVLVSNSEIIHLKSYKAAYTENPKRTINELTKHITELLRGQLTYLENANLTPLHDQIQSITKLGIAHRNTNQSIPLEKRWRYSQKLAQFINENFDSEAPKWQSFENDINNYFNTLSKHKIEDNWVTNYQNKNQQIVPPLHYLLLILGLPIFILGSIHHLVPYYWLKRFVEKTFKRRVFWSGIKMILGFFILSVYNIALVLIVNAVFNLTSTGVAWLYIIGLVPLLGLLAYEYNRIFKAVMIRKRLKRATFDQLVTMRTKVEALINSTIQL